MAVLTEGDHIADQLRCPLSCVPAFTITLIQMVGRGLRTVDPGGVPYVIKSDCLVLDFRTASLMHGS